MNFNTPLSCLFRCILIVLFFEACGSDQELYDVIQENEEFAEEIADSQDDTTEAEDPDTTPDEGTDTDITEESTDDETMGGGDEDPGDVGTALYGENIFYVTVSGSSSNDGKTEETAWDIEFAFQNAKPGDEIYVKAGNYGGLELKVNNSGFDGQPIRFIGYKNVPQDIESVGGPTVSYDDYKSYGDSFNAEDMPTLVGERVNDVGLGSGIHILEKDYIELENFQISRYESNVLVQYSDYVKLTNLILSDSGDFNPEHTDANGVNGLNNTGEGVAAFFSDHITIGNCLSINDGMRGIMVSDSNFGEHFNSRVYSDNNVNSCDYYYLLYNADNHVVDNIYVERIGNLVHEGHGLCLKDGSSNNLIKNSYVKATMLELSFDNVHDNIVQDCYVEGGFNEGELRVANGAHDNKYYRVTVAGGEGGVTFCDWIDGGSDDISNAGYNNEFYDCTFSDMRFGIGFYFFDQFDTEAHDNSFYNCTFKNLDYLFEVDRPNRNTILENCELSNIPSMLGFYYTSNNYRSVDVDYINLSSNNVGF